jgi:hypothetical protein
LAAILSPLGLYGGNRKSKIPFPSKNRYNPLKGGFRRLQAISIGRMPGDRNLLSLDKSLAILTRVLRFEDRCSSPVRLVPTGQTGQTHRSDWSGTAAAPSSVLRSWLCGSTKEPSGFLVNHRKPRELGVASANLHL